MIKKLSLAIIAFCVFSACTDESTNGDICVDYELEAVSSVTEIPVLVAGTFAFDVSFQVNNGCGQFYAFDEQTQGNSKTIRVSAKYEGCVCTDDVPTRTATYQFTPTAPGTYTLNFVKDDGSFITKTVVLN